MGARYSFEAVVTRHNSDCADRNKGMGYTKCNCRKSFVVYDSALKQQKRLSAKTRNWDEAVEAAQEWIANQGSPTIAEAITAYLTAKANDWKKGTAARQAAIWGDGKENKGSLREYLDTLKPAPVLLRDITTDMLHNWRATWKYPSDLTTATAVTHVRSFFKWLHEAGYLANNPALLFKRPKTKKGARTTAFSAEEYARILAAADDSKLKTLVELMRWTGRALEDAVTYNPSSLTGDVMTYRRGKSGSLAGPITIPQHLVVALRDLKGDQPFRDPSIRLASDKHRWHLRLQALFTKAGIRMVRTELGQRPPHSHMFRDTFAINNILAGMEVLEVSRMLGHSSVLITQRYYLPWILQMQEHHISKHRASLAAQLPKAAGRVVPIVKTA